MAGQTPKSIRAFANLKVLCEEHLKGRYRIEVIDLMENPQLARGDQIVAVPTLVRDLPGPVRKIIGDLSNTERMLMGLDAANGRLTRLWKVHMKRPSKKTRPAGKRKPGSPRKMEQAGASFSPGKVRLAFVHKRIHVEIGAGCKEYQAGLRAALEGRYDLEVIDIYQQANLARDEQIVAVPTLIKRLPLPLRRLIGDLSNQDKVLFGLDLKMQE